MRIYLDTNVYLDYFFNRVNESIPSGELAYLLLRRTVSCEFDIVISDIILVELEKVLTKTQIRDLLDWLQPKLLSTRRTQKDSKNAKLFPIHFPDNLHFAIAKRMDACIISNDKQMVTLGALPSHSL